MPDALFTSTDKSISPIVVNNTRVIPVAQSFTMRLPGYRGTLTYSRPKEVVVLLANGDTYSIPIIDQTRQRQILIICVGLIASLITWLMFRESN